MPRQLGTSNPASLYGVQAQSNNVWSGQLDQSQPQYYVTQQLEINRLMNELTKAKKELNKQKEKKPMFAWLSTSKLRMQLAEMEHKHKLQMEEITAKFNREKSEWEKDRERFVSDLKKDSDLKLNEAVTMAKLDYEQRIKQAELTAQEKINNHTKKLNDENYEKLSTSMTKLHEEGNQSTKFLQEIASKMMGSMPKHKTQTKILTGTVKDGK